jgi:hypothetical protein
LRPLGQYGSCASRRVCTRCNDRIRESALDRNSVAGLEAPAPGSLDADFFDDADRFMPGDHR